VSATDPDTPGLAALITELTAESREFARLWQRYDVRRRRGEPKTFRHPHVGILTLSFEALHLEDGQRVSVYQAAPGSTDHDALALLALLAAEAPGRPAAS
jgi:hypothetical protein